MTTTQMAKFKSIDDAFEYFVKNEFPFIDNPEGRLKTAISRYNNKKSLSQGKKFEILEEFSSIKIEFN